MPATRLSASLLAFAALATPALLAPAAAADRRADPLRLAIATFNARFLFDGVLPEGDAPFPWKADAVLARRHVRDIAAILSPLDADIINISEVEDIATLRRLALEIGDPTYEAYLIPGKDTFTRQNVGLLTRIDPDHPLERTDEWASGPGGGPPQGVPKNYAAAITVGRIPLLLVGAHLLAFPDDPDRAARREGQAEVLRRFTEAAGTNRGRLAIVLGDLNDYDPDVPDSNGDVPVSRVLETLKVVSRRDAADDLINAAALLPVEERFSAFRDLDMDGADDGPAERSLTDHVLVPRALEGAIASVEVVARHDPTGPSDHFPLVVTLDLSRAGVFIRGDMSGDRRIDLGDALALLRRLFQGGAGACDDAGDLDDDGTLTVTDAVLLLLELERLAPPAPPPGPGLPGLDPTPDILGCP